MTDVPDRSQDLIADLAGSAGAALGVDAQRQIVRAAARERYAGRSILAAVGRLFRKLTAGIASLLADAWRAAWLLGGASLPPVRPPEPTPPPTAANGQPPDPPLPPVVIAQESPEWDGDPLWLPVIEAALDDLHAKQGVSKQQWDALSKQAREDAFAVAETMTADASQHVQQAVSESIDKGGTLAEFKDNLAANVETSALGPAAVENVLRTSTMIAYNAGFEAVREENDAEFPFVETVPIRDDRLTPLCALIARSGIHGTAIYAANDPVWRRFRNPRHWNCRCGTLALTAEDAAAKGVHEVKYVAWPKVQLPKGWEPGGVGVLL